jgi:uncharacterized membrane protein
MQEQQSSSHPAVSPAKINYFLLIVSLFAGGVTAIIALVIAYVYRSDCPEWLKSHFDYQIRTFWIGCLVLFVGVVTTFIGIGVIILIGATIWLIVRCVKGIKFLDQQLPHPNPKSWWL